MTILLVIHVLSAIAGFGVIFSFPFLGYHTENQPRLALGTARINELLVKRWVLPAAGIQLVTGVWLLLSLKLDLTKNAWLGVSIVLFLIAMGVSSGYMLPRETKLVGLLEKADGADHSEEARALMKTLRVSGQALTLILVVIIVLMVWKPGFTS